MYCINTEFIQEETVKKSRFIGIISPCHNEQEVQLKLRQLHGDYADATHIAYAYRFKTDNGLQYRFHDANEPTGTAGKPIFQQLDGKGLVNVLIAVIRYYGGIKLGAGGLTRAYGNAARNVIENAVLHQYIEWANVPLTLDYKDFQALEYLLKKIGGRIVKQDFTEQIKLVVQLPEEQIAQLQQGFPGNY